MISRETFVDSNILIYVHDKADLRKGATAEKIIEGFWNQSVFPSLSFQVLMEFSANLKKAKLTLAEISKIVIPFLEWNIVQGDSTLFRQTIHICEKHQLSFWDSAIVAAAQKAGCKVILSEDFQHNRSYEGIKVINPFI